MHKGCRACTRIGMGVTCIHTIRNTYLEALRPGCMLRPVATPAAPRYSCSRLSIWLLPGPAGGRRCGLPPPLPPLHVPLRAPAPLRRPPATLHADLARPPLLHCTPPVLPGGGPLQAGPGALEGQIAGLYRHCDRDAGLPPRLWGAFQEHVGSDGSRGCKERDCSTGTVGMPKLW